MNTNFLCVFDLETSHKKPELAQILEIGAYIIERNNLQIVDEFSTLVKPVDFTAVTDEALGINKILISDLEKAPETTTAWKQFCSWVNKYNKSKNSPTSYDAPIACGYNIQKYDLKIITRYCNVYGPWDVKREDQKLFNQVYNIDVLQHLFFWFENNMSVSKLNLPSVMEYVGLPQSVIEQTHGAKIDARITAEILIKLLKAERYLTDKDEITKKRRMELKGCLKGWKNG